MTQGVTELLSQALGPAQRRRAAPAAAPTPPIPPRPAQPADGLQLSLAGGPLQKLLAGQEPSPSEWLGLARQVSALTSSELRTLNNRLAASQASLLPVDGGRLVLYRTPDVAVAIEPERGRLRRAAGTRVDIFEGDRRATSMVAQDGRITLTHGRDVQVWHGASGQGTHNGRPLTVPPAPLVPGEPPREFLQVPARNQFRLPRFREGQDAADYVAQVDEAVVRAGGRILRSADAALPDADWSNCFSHALTQGGGDLADPFTRNQMPRWVQSPMFQLAMRGWGQLGATQRVHAGDLVLYRDAQGAASHAGIVRAVDETGNATWIESKFGAWGVYLHRPQDVHPAYGTPTDFFRRP